MIRYPFHQLARALAFLEATPHLPWDDLVDADYALDDARAAIAAAEARSVTRAGIVVGEG